MSRKPILSGCSHAQSHHLPHSGNVLFQLGTHSPHMPQFIALTPTQLAHPVELGKASLNEVLCCRLSHCGHQTGDPDSELPFVWLTKQEDKPCSCCSCRLSPMLSSLCSCSVKQPCCHCFRVVSIDAPALLTSLSISRIFGQVSSFCLVSSSDPHPFPADSPPHGSGRLPTEGRPSHSSISMLSMLKPPPCALVDEPFPSVPTPEPHCVVALPAHPCH